MVSLTKRSIDSASPKQHEFHLWDTTIRGFGLRVHPSGTKTFILKKRTVAGHQIKLTIGRFGELTVDQARKRALELAADIVKGQNPADKRRESRRNPRFSDFAAWYIANHCEVKNKPTTLRNNRSMIQSLLIPRFGSRPISEIGHEEVLRLRNSHRQKPYRANRAIALLRHMMNVAEQAGHRPKHSNPCPKGILLPERHRNRFLSEDELIRLSAVLRRYEAEHRELLPSSKPQLSAVFAIRLLILTGARLSEVLTLRWDSVDFERATIWLKDSKTGAKPIFLSTGTVELLRAIPRDGENPYVIPGRKADTCLVNLEKPWRAIRKEAGLPDVRLHDLRHTFASYGVASGLGLPVIGMLLGHKNSATTQRYAHVGAHPARQAAETIARRIGATLNGSELPIASRDAEATDA